MSMVPKDTIEVIAQNIGILGLSPSVALALATDLEYRLREMMQEAVKCMRHSKRTILTVNDVDSALSLKNVEPIYGFASRDPLQFRKATGHKDLYYIDDEELDFKDAIEAPLPKAPLDITVVVHWLAINGVQPAIPENAPVEGLSCMDCTAQEKKNELLFIAFRAKSDNKNSEHGRDNALPFDIKLPIKHVLSRELQLYFDKIIELTMSRSNSVPFKRALQSLATDPGLHPLVPYFSYFITDELTRSLNDLPLLFALMRIIRSLLRNPHIHIEPYLHQLMPPMVTCLVAKRLGHDLADDHWELRDFSANLVAAVCGRFGQSYPNLQSRVTKTLLHAFPDPKKLMPCASNKKIAMAQQYGVIQGLAALGSNVVRRLILSNIEIYMQLLESEMLLEEQKNELKRKEAWRVYGALMCVTGRCLYDRFKAFLSLPSPPRTQPLWRTNGRVVTTVVTNKRKSRSNDSLQQPLLKKPASSMPANLQASATPSLDPAIGQSSGSGQVSNGNTSNGSRRGESSVRAEKMSAALAEGWKEDVDVGPLLASLFEWFGEGILSFTQPVEMIFFL